MNTFPRRLHTAPTRPAFRRLVKSASAVTPEAVLVYPGPDLQGDVIEPDGGNWAPFEAAGRLVNFEHGPWVGTGQVQMKSIEYAGDEIDVPVGTTQFFTKSADLAGLKLPKRDDRGDVVGRWTPDDCLKYAEQVAPLVLDGTLDGVSIEFRPSGPEGRSYKSLGPNPYLHGRNACHFYEWDALTWAAACRQPVNNNARYVKSISDELLRRAERAVKELEKSHTLPLIRKSLSPLAAVLDTRRKVVPVKTTRLKKAAPYEDDDEAVGDGPLPGLGDDADMGSDDMAPPDAVDTPPMDETAPMMDEGMETQAEPPPSVAAGTDAAQALLDGSQAILSGFDTAAMKLKASDNPSARNKMKALMDAASSEIQGVIKRHAAKLQKAADQLASKLASNDESPVDEMATEQAEDVDTDESGMVVGKSFPLYIPEPRRLKKGDLKPPVRRPKAKPSAAAIDLEKLAELERKFGLN